MNTAGDHRSPLRNTKVRHAPILSSWAKRRILPNGIVLLRRILHHFIPQDDMSGRVTFVGATCGRPLHRRFIPAGIVHRPTAGDHRSPLRSTKVRHAPILSSWAKRRILPNGIVPLRRILHHFIPQDDMSGRVIFVGATCGRPLRRRFIPAGIVHHPTAGDHRSPLRNTKVRRALIWSS